MPSKSISIDIQYQLELFHVAAKKWLLLGTFGTAPAAKAYAEALVKANGVAASVPDFRILKRDTRQTILPVIMSKTTTKK